MPKKIYVLKRRRDVFFKNYYNVHHGLVVSAVDSVRARMIATDETGEKYWLLPGMTSCDAIGESTVEAGVILSDYNAG